MDVNRGYSEGKIKIGVYLNGSLAQKKKLWMYELINLSILLVIISTTVLIGRFSFKVVVSLDYKWTVVIGYFKIINKNF